MSALSCPRCKASLTAEVETCPTCGFRFQLSESSIRFAGRHGSGIEKQHAERELFRRKDPDLIRLCSVILIILALAMVALSWDAIQTPEALACSNLNRFLCAMSFDLGNRLYSSNGPNKFYASMMFSIALLFAALARYVWKLASRE
jgi:hypothetical protein